MTEYAELHAHSYHSLLDGASAPEDLAARAKALGLRALALTDHDSLAGLPRFLAAARREGLPALVGAEVSLEDGSHLTLLADSQTGYASLCRLISRSRLDALEAAGAIQSDRSARDAALPQATVPTPPVRSSPSVRSSSAARSSPSVRSSSAARSSPSVRSAEAARPPLADPAAWPGKLPARLGWERLAEGTAGLLCLSGCRRGPLAAPLLRERPAAARAAGGRLRELFGPDRLYVELQDAALPDSAALVARLRRLARELELPVVASHNVHHAEPAGARLRAALIAIDHNLSLGRARAAGLLPANAVQCLQSATAMARRFGECPEALAAGLAIAERCRFDWDLGPLRLPPFLPPSDGPPQAFARLYQLCHAQLGRRYPELGPAVLKQLAHELAVIDQAGLADYFLIVHDIVGFARGEGIRCQGRGSAANSIVAYLLGITSVDPLAHDLLFERFLSADRFTSPDIDLDIAADRREEVIQYVYRRYGHAHTAMVCNTVTYQARSALRDLGRALDFPAPVLQALARRLDGGSCREAARQLEALAEQAEAAMVEGGERSDEGADLGEGPDRNEGPDRGDRPDRRDGPDRRQGSDRREGPDRRQGSDRREGPDRRQGSDRRDGPDRRQDSDRREGPDRRQGSDRHEGPDRHDPSHRPDPAALPGRAPYRLLAELLRQVDGCPRHLSIHSGGMLITGPPIDSLVPLEPATLPGRLVCQWDKDSVEDAGLIKLDLLGLRMLAVLSQTLEILADAGLPPPDLDALRPDDPAVYAQLQAGDSIGVFQVESRAQQQMLPRLRPRCFADLVVQVAIVRPGPIQGGAVHPYLRRRLGLEPVRYPHPCLEPVLRETLGVLLYQEQAIRVAVAAAGFSPGEADLLRRSLSRSRSTDELALMERRFLAGAAAQGIAAEQGAEIWRLLAGFAGYGFPKSHSASFALIVYQSAWLRHYHPAAFTCALLNQQPMGFYSPSVLLGDARRHGVKLLPPDIHRSEWGYRLEAWPVDPAPALSTSSAPSAPSTSSAPSGPSTSPTSAGPSTPSLPATPSLSATSFPPAVDTAAPTAPPQPALRAGLSTVRGLGPEAWERIAAARGAGPFQDLFDLQRRCGLSRELMANLVRAGALDGLAGGAGGRRRLLWALGDLPDRAQPEGLPLRLDSGLPELPPLPPLTQTLWELELLGVSAGPQLLAHYREALAAAGVPCIAQLRATGREGRVCAAGLVVTRQRPQTAKGILFLTLEDETGLLDVVVKPDLYARHREVLRYQPLLLVQGELQRGEGAVSLLLEEVRALG